MTFASIIVPAFNVQETLAETLGALLAQCYPTYEIIIVDDGSTDATARIASGFTKEAAVRVIRQPNRGLAGARNTGIAASRGSVIGFCDADDLWEPEKLALHIAHLEANHRVGISFSGSSLIDDTGAFTGQAQRPRLRDIDAKCIFKRNPVGNGSAAILRREVFDAIAFRPDHETARDWYFDETFRQSEDIECWLRIALSTDWEFEGVPGALTRYRISAGGLSSATDRQLASWERMVDKLQVLAPAFFAAETPAARAYQLRYLSRRAISDLDASRAVELTRAWVKTSWTPLREEPLKSVVTLAAACVLSLLGPRVLRQAMTLAARTGATQ
jgi:glycosyltransferase involved in cell wall biosynthesis